MEPPDAVRSAPIAMTETSFLFIVLFLASMKDLPCCRVPAQLSMAYKEIFPCLASLTLCCGALPAIYRDNEHVVLLLHQQTGAVREAPAASRTRLVRDATTCGGPALPSPQPKPCARDASRAACDRCVAAARSERRSWVSLRRLLAAGRLPASPWPACPRIAGRWRWTGCAPCAATAARLPGVFLFFCFISRHTTARRTQRVSPRRGPHFR